jgi:short subunit dehydrogenase-like uncharacterized protein
MAPAAFINPAVIHRTAQLAAEGRDGVADPFCYREGFALEGGPASLPLRYAAAGLLSGTQAAVLSAARARPAVRKRVGRTLSRVLPSSGFGPSGERLERWSWRMSIEGKTAGAHNVRVNIVADGHPGYLATARMMGEAGLLLSEAGATPDRAGCLTPATALGTGCIKRFERAQVRFSVAG